MANIKPIETTGLQEKFAWEKPERKDQSGSLVIFGGSSFKLKEVDTVFKSAKSYGVGTVSALVPESMARVFKRDDPYLVPVVLDSYFGLTDSGLNTLKEELLLADALILADIGNNSSTGLKLARLISDSVKPVILTDSAISLISNYSNEILQNPNVTLVLNLQNVQKLIKASSLTLSSTLSSELGINKKLDLLNELVGQIKANLVLIDESRVISVGQEFYLNSKLCTNSLDLTARLVAWSIWSPTSLFLERLFIASS